MPTSIKTIELAFKFYEFFTGNSIYESNLYKFVCKYGNDPLIYERFMYGELLVEHNINEYCCKFGIPCSVVRSGFGFIERDTLINYFFLCLCISPSDRFKRDISDAKMHYNYYAQDQGPYYTNQNIDSYLSHYPNILKSIPRLNKKGIEFEVNDLFQPLHIRDMFKYLYEHKFGKIECENESIEELTELKERIKELETELKTTQKRCKRLQTAIDIMKE